MTNRKYAIIMTDSTPREYIPVDISSTLTLMVALVCLLRLRSKLVDEDVFDDLSGDYLRV